MSTRIYLFIHYWWIDRNYSIKLLTRYYPPRYLLCSSTFPLRTKNGSCIRYFCSIYTLIPTSIRFDPTYTMGQCPILPDIFRCKFNLFSTTLSRFKGYTTTIFRLSRCLYKMKCSFLIRVSSLICSTDIIHLHFMRSICFSTKGSC